MLYRTIAPRGLLEPDEVVEKERLPQSCIQGHEYLGDQV